MTESVTQIITGRSGRPERLRPMLLYSTLAHAVLLIVVPVLISLTPDTPPPVRMVINLSAGSAGPRTEGRTQIGGRPVQQVAPEAPVRPAEPAPPPPPEKPRMAIPEPKPEPPRPTPPKPEPPKPVPPPKPEPPKPEPKPAPRPEAVVAEARPTTTPPRPAPPTTGEEVRTGSARVETGARGTGFGLSSGGQNRPGGSSVQLDVKDFCCPEYIERMLILIDRNWQRNQGRGGEVVIRFTIERDGTLDAVSVSRSSGAFPLDQAAERAVLLTRQLPRLPDAFPNPTLTVHLTFGY